MWAWVAGLIGAVLGAMAGREGIWLLGGLVGWLLVRTVQLQRRVTRLEQAEATATEPLGAPTAAREAADATDAAVPQGLADPVPPSSATAAPLPTTASPIVRAEPDLADRFAAALRAWLFGGNTIVKAGVAILFIGLAFLAKYASEHVDVPPELRLAGVGAVALVLLGLGWRVRAARPGYAQALQGGAVAVLYLTVFVALRWYGLFGVLPAFVAMVAVAALAAALAVLQNALPLAAIGALGGFMVPLLVSSGSGNVSALFGYYLVLDLGIAAIAYWRAWRVLNLIGFAFTFGVFGSWAFLRFAPDQYAMVQAFLALFFAVFLAILLLRGRLAQQSPGEPAAAGAARLHQWVDGTLLFGLPTIVFALQMGLMGRMDFEYGRAFSALVLGAIYVGLALRLKTRPGFELAFEGALGVAAVLLTLTIPLALDSRSTAAAWALEGGGLVWLGLRQQRRLARALGYLLVLIAGFALIRGMDLAGTPTHWLNGSLIGGLLTCAGALLGALAVRRAAGQGSMMPGEAIAEPLLVAWGSLLLLAVGVVQIEALVATRWQLSVMVMAWAGMATAYALLALRLNWPVLAQATLLHAPWLLLAVWIGAATQAAPWSGGGAWAWPLALAAQLWVLKAAGPFWPRRLATAAHALGPLVLASLGALAGRAITRDWGDDGSAWRWLGWLAVPALLTLVLIRPAAQRRWPAAARPQAYHPLASGLLVACLLAWVLLANVASNGSARPLPHVPLLNPLDLGLGLALFAAMAWMRESVVRALAPQADAVRIGLIGALGFLWLNGMLIRAFHHYGEVPYRFSAWTDSLPVQTGLTLLWTVTALALMWFSARRAQRLPWLVGAALLGLVVLKLVLVDLSGSGTVTRIVSFIGVGVLMLVIGWVAPLPAARPREVESDAPGSAQAQAAPGLAAEGESTESGR